MNIVQQFDNKLPQHNRALRRQPVGIVIHSIARTIEGLLAPDWLESVYDQIHSSAHFFIDLDGTIYQRVPVTWRANHAGKSEHLGLSGLNDDYLSAEFMANFDSRGYVDYKAFCDFIDRDQNWKGGNQVYTMSQLIAGNQLVNWLMKEIPTIEYDRIERHSIVSPDSLRGPGEGKIDPGKAFPWEVFKKSIVQR